MDSLTHIVLGACVGEAALSHKLGKKALAVGAVAQSFPDIDGVASLWLSPTESLLFHRGITHSFLFGLLAAVAFALLTQRLFSAKSLPFTSLLVFFALQFWLHDVLDTCNAYGTGLLKPFSDQRFSWGLLFVADPFFTLPLLLASLALLMLRKPHPVRKTWLAAGLLLPGLYLVYAGVNKMTVDRQVKKVLAEQPVPTTAFFTKPTAFNTWLWYVVAPVDSGYYIGYRSVFDRESYVTPFTFYPQNAALLLTVDNAQKATLENLLTFADGNYTVASRSDTLVFNVIRFGRIAGWRDHPTHFTFQYYLNPGFDNALVVQRGRAQEWRWPVFQEMYERIRGKPTVYHPHPGQ